MKMRSMLIAVLIIKAGFSLSAKEVLVKKDQSRISKSEVRSVLNTDIYETQVTFSAGYQIGDYVEFLKASPLFAGAAGNYEISIAYTRCSIASAATYLASIIHVGADVWREAGRINGNSKTTESDYTATKRY